MSILKRSKPKKKVAKPRRWLDTYGLDENTRQYLSKLSLGDAWSYEDVIGGIGKAVKDSKVDGADHPRALWALTGFYEIRYRYQRGDKNISRAEFDDANEEINAYNAGIERQTDERKKKFMLDMRKSCKRAAERKTNVEMGPRGTGRRLIDTEKELKEKIERIDENLKYNSAISDCLLSVATGLATYVITNQVLVGVAVGSGTAVTRFGDKIAYNHACNRKDAINADYKPILEGYRRYLAARRNQITIQTVIEVTNYLENDIPGSVIKA